jgi:hypothetical protein
MQIFCDVAQPMGLFQGDTETSACLRNGGDDELDSWISIHIVVVNNYIDHFHHEDRCPFLVGCRSFGFRPCFPGMNENVLGSTMVWMNSILTFCVVCSLPDLEASP